MLLRIRKAPSRTFYINLRLIVSFTTSQKPAMPLNHYNFGAMTDAQKVAGKAFMKNSTFAVVGASKDQSKVGNKILRWYQARVTDVIPVHPKERELEGLKSITDISQLSSPSTTALSIITPPQITLSVLKKAKQLNVPSYWIQPGAEDEAVLQYIKENGLIDRVICGGPCILVLGDGIRSHLWDEVVRHPSPLSTPRPLYAAGMSSSKYTTFMHSDTLFDIDLRNILNSLVSSVASSYAMLSLSLPICEKQERFFASSQFAVIGASSDPSKPASKVLDWYHNKHMDVIPVHPKEKRLEGLSAIPSISKLPSPSTTALTISATPQVTLSLLKQAHKLSILTIWIQPGASDQHVVEYIEANNLSEKVIWGGPCILREGEHLIQRRWFDEIYS